MALPEDRRIPVDKFPEDARKFISPETPPPLRAMVARGLVPMKPIVQLCALYQIARVDESLREEAVATVRKLPVAAVKQIAAERILPVVLDWLAEIYRQQPDVLRTLIQNKQTDVDTLIQIARHATAEDIIETVANNQQRLLESGPLVAAIYLNRHTRASTADRVFDFAARAGVDLSSIPNHDHVLAALQSEPVAARTAEQEAAMDRAMRDVREAVAAIEGDAPPSDEDLPDEATGDERELDETPEVEVEGEEVVQMKRTAAARIRDMNVAQKVRMACMGNKTERGILIHDTNKMVARAVIRSPAMTAAEVALYARDKSLLDEIIAYIATSRKWTRKYHIKRALVANPKTPLGVAVNLLAYLRSNDVRAIARSRDVSGPVQKAAKDLIKKQQGQSTKR